MTELKASCPKCSGHIVFPTELAGQEVACPHCAESILLPKSRRVTAWAVAATFALSTVCLISILIWQHESKRGRQASSPVGVSEAQKTKLEHKDKYAQHSKDEQAIENLCKEYYRSINDKDAGALYRMMAEPCRKALSIEEIKKGHEDVSNYEFVAVESVRFQEGPLGRCAMARVKRTKSNSFLGIQEGDRYLRFIRESGGWRLFSDVDLKLKMIDQFAKSGLSDQVKANIQLLRSGDPFSAWEKNDTNVFETVFKSLQGQRGIFPWNVEFVVGGNKIDGHSLVLNFSVRNTSSNLWSSPPLEFKFKHGGKPMFSGNEWLRDVGPGQKVERDVSIFLEDTLQETIKFDLDVSYSFGGTKCQLAGDVPVLVEVSKLTDVVKFEVVTTSFDLAKTRDFRDMWSARLDYRVKNVSARPIERLSLKCVSSSQKGEELDQSTDYIVGYGDVPLYNRA
jgi:hypothetical protein